jgi:hypothetical protein
MLTANIPLKLPNESSKKKEACWTEGALADVIIVAYQSRHALTPATRPDTCCST